MAQRAEPRAQRESSVATERMGGQPPYRSRTCYSPSCLSPGTRTTLQPSHLHQVPVTRNGVLRPEHARRADRLCGPSRISSRSRPRVPANDLCASSCSTTSGVRDDDDDVTTAASVHCADDGARPPDQPLLPLPPLALHRRTLDPVLDWSLL